jgi:hypothetical protein
VLRERLIPFPCAAGGYGLVVDIYCVSYSIHTLAAVDSSATIDFVRVRDELTRTPVAELAIPVQVTKAEGVAGLYRGFTSVLVGALPGNMAYFGGYEVGKRVRTPPRLAGVLRCVGHANVMPDDYNRPATVLLRRRLAPEALLGGCATWADGYLGGPMKGQPTASVWGTHFSGPPVHHCDHANGCVP